MRPVWIAADHMISPLGWSSEENYEAIRSGKTGISQVNDHLISPLPVYLGKIIDHRGEPGAPGLTPFELLAIRSAQEALNGVQLNPAASNVLFVLSTTKGNIGLLEEGKANDSHIHLPAAAAAISRFFGNPNLPVVVSNACISGVAAILMGARMIGSGVYDHVVITGADMLSKFVVSGFQCLSALSPEPCRPFDLNRKGTTLGEAVGTLILSHDPSGLGSERRILVAGGATSNDANHISGPSRTGEELGMAIGKALRESGLQPKEVDFISAHGTATVFNDEMEAKAFKFAGLEEVPVNSLKGNLGHTLGAAGIVESIISLHALINNELLPTYGFSEMGVSVPLQVSKTATSRKLKTCLKTASGFGGCNTAMILQKLN